MHLGRPQSKTKKAASRIELAAPSKKSKGLYKSNKRNHIIPQTSESVSIRLPGGVPAGAGSGLGSPGRRQGIRTHLCLVGVKDKIRDIRNELLRILSKEEMSGFILDGHLHVRILRRD